MAPSRALLTRITLLFCLATTVFLLSACQGDDSLDEGIVTDEVDTTDSSIQIGSGGGASFQNGTAAAELVSASATSAVWNVSVVVANANNIAVTETYNVSFNSPCVASGLASLSSSTVVSVAGRVSTQYTSGTCNGIDTVVATVNDGSGNITAQVDINIAEALAAAGGGSGATDLSLGSGTGAGFTEGNLSASSTSLQAGATALISANLVDADNEPFVSPVVVTFSSGCVSTGLASFSEAQVTSSGGLSNTLYTAAGCSGTDTITARATHDGQALSATIDLDIAVDTVLGVEFVSNSDATLSLAGIGGDETAIVTFRIVGAQGAPIVNETVSFEISNAAGGATLASGTETGQTNTSGEVSTVVQSGTVNSNLRVIATHDTTGIQGFSDDITISTGVPVSRAFDLSLTPFNPHAWEVNGAEVTITAHVSDQFGNAPPDNTRVSFRSPEIGIVGSSCALVDGRCSVVWRSSGDRSGITADVSGRTGRATIIGFMSGSEDFIDQNANGLFDAGNATEVASVVDLPEAFADENEDGIFNTNEDYVDSFLNNPAPSDGSAGNVNGSYDDSGDNIYNGPCSELINTSCPATELQSTTIWDSVVISLSSWRVQFCDEGNLPAVGTEIDLTPTFDTGGIVFCDENGNSLPVDTTITFIGDEIDLVGSTTYSITGDTTEPTTPINLRLVPQGAVNADAAFTILVATPGSATQSFTWPVNE